jgi:splicing factor 3A subunit 1
VFVAPGFLQDDDCIVPPPDIRLIADKTADFVARNGPEFESRIMATNQGNAKFRFLTLEDPFRPYYDMKVRQVREALAEEKVKASLPPPAPVETAKPADDAVDEAEDAPAAGDDKAAEVSPNSAHAA